MPHTDINVSGDRHFGAGGPSTLLQQQPLTLTPEPLLLSLLCQ
jgi:hypothetical protein